MPDELVKALDELTPVQREAALWEKGPMLVLAGPGSGKTRVLTTRVAHLLEKEKVGKILALTYTTKAADEMKTRIKSLTDQEERVVVGTFHSFCVNVLKQHGIHVGIKPDFSIYSREDDRKALLKDAIASAGRTELLNRSDEFLKAADGLKKRLLGSASAEKMITGTETAKRVAAVYDIYTQALADRNILDFDSIIFETCRLFKAYPAIAAQYQKTYTYWLIDEFQDTTPAQYFLIKTLAVPDFRNIFIVADDDQIIYQWNGASHRQLEKFTVDFEPTLIQLPQNFRCPPAIIELANLLVINNTSRMPGKQPLEAGKTTTRLPASEHVQLSGYADDVAEIAALVQDVESKVDKGSVAVLARTRFSLAAIGAELRKAGIPSVIAQRRDDFLTPKFAWLDSALKQAAFPLDKRNLHLMVDSFNRFTGLEISTEKVILEAEVVSKGYIESWAQLVSSSTEDPLMIEIASALLSVSKNNTTFRRFIASAIAFFKEGVDLSQDPDLTDDLDAWKGLIKEIKDSGGDQDLIGFAQELGMRSKEPPLKEGCVSLLTIHAAKGKEFDYVYLTGAAEGMLPSYQSVIEGDKSRAMEEERRNCFVAITRTKESLIISYPEKQRGYTRKPSRFLGEMGLIK